METEKQQDLEKNKIFVPLEREEDKKIPNFPIDLEKIEEILEDMMIEHLIRIY